MHRTVSRGLPRLLRLSLPVVAVLALGLGACSEPAAPEGPVPTPSSTPSSAAPSSAAPAATLAVPDGSTGSDGLTVRYLAQDGTVKTVRVEEFRARR
jgi:hypothetical protein